MDNAGDDLCFIWSVLVQLHPAADPHHTNRVSNYSPYIQELNLDGITFPISIEYIQRFNKHNLSTPVNVFDIKFASNKKEYKILTPIIKEHLNSSGCNLFVYKGHFVLFHLAPMVWCMGVLSPLLHA